MRKRDQLSVSDIGTSGWAIEGYPVPLTEREAEKIASQADTIDSLKKQVELLEELINFCRPIVEDASTMNHDGQANWYIDNADEVLKKLEKLRSEG